MKIITTREIIVDGGKYTYKPWYLAKKIWGGKLVGDDVLYSDHHIPFYLGVAYRHWAMRATVMYPKPLHLIARFVHWLDYWSWIETGQKSNQREV